MIIDCISDLHGHYPKLEGGDLLIVAGDLTATDTPTEFLKFCEFIRPLNYKKKIVIAGNHDNICRGMPHMINTHKEFTYLCDSGTEFEGLKIWGSPWTLKFPGMNPHCMAFTCNTEAELAEKWSMIPQDIDILITHGPPFGICDVIGNMYDGTISCVGSKSLHKLLYAEELKPLLHIFGHIHEGYAHIPKMLDYPKTQFINCSHVNERYQPVNKPIRVVL